MALRWSIRVGLVVLALAALAAAGWTQDDVPPAASRGGMEAHVDPGTGRFVPEPAVPPTGRPLPAPAPPLAEVPAPGGGMMVPLGGRFMSNVVATVNPDGSIRVDCTTGDAPAPTD